MNPNEALRHHVTGAVERGEATPITERRDCANCPGEIEFDGGEWFHTRIDDGTHAATPKEN